MEHILDRMFEGQIEPTIAELDFGMFLRRQGVAFRYVIPPVSKHGTMMLCPYEGGPVACGDIKCKLEGTDYAKSSLLNSLKKAQRQFPSDMPGIVFVKVPQRWVDLNTGNLGLETDVSDMLAKFFQTAKRVVLVVFYTKLTTHVPEGTAIRQRGARARESQQPACAGWLMVLVQGGQGAARLGRLQSFDGRQLLAITPAAIAGSEPTPLANNKGRDHSRPLRFSAWRRYQVRRDISSLSQGFLASIVLARGFLETRAALAAIHHAALRRRLRALANSRFSVEGT